MAVTTVGEILRRTKIILQELTQNGTRWTNEELLGWLNESYQAIVAIKPDASSANKIWIAWLVRAKKFRQTVTACLILFAIQQLLQKATAL